MIVEIPFIMRFTGHTPNNGAIRQIASYDTHRMDIADLSPSEFTEGSYLGGGIGTLLKDGEHWAYWGTSEAGSLDNRPIDEHARGRAMSNLTSMIDTTRFFDEGRAKLLVNRLMSKPPHEKYIVTSERERNVGRLSDWIMDNVAMIGDHLAVKVGEPSMRLLASEPDDRGRVALWVARERLTPLLGRYGGGIHVPIAERAEIVDLARESVRTNPMTDKMLVMMEDEEFARITTEYEPVEDMHERSLRSLASAVTSKGPRGKNGKAVLPHFERLDTLADMPVGSVSAADLDAMMDDLVAVSANAHPTISILIGIAATRWEDRPVQLPDMEARILGIGR